MKGLRINLTLLLLLGLIILPSHSWALTATASANVSATILLSGNLTLVRDTNSVVRGSVSQVVFDKRDDQDAGVASPNAGYMYAPYRSEVGKNWHLTDIVANGSSMALTAKVTGTAGATPLANVLRVWCGGFFLRGAGSAMAGTATVDDGNPATDDWEYLDGFTRTLSQPFTGTVPFNYRLDISSLPVGGPYSGTITFTLTTT